MKKTNNVLKTSILEGVEAAGASIDSGAASEKLDALIRFTRDNA